MSTINSIRKKNSNNRQQAGVWAKTTIKCSRVATAKITKSTHTKATANRTHNLSSRDIKLKIRECAQWKVFVRQCLNKDIESHCTPTSAKYLWGLKFALNSRQLQILVPYFAGDLLVQYATDQLLLLPVRGECLTMRYLWPQCQKNTITFMSR